MVEGDFWVYAHTDLTDFYAGRLTARQLWVRFTHLPAEARIWAALQAEHRTAELDAEMARFLRTNRGG